ncbi:MAG TPA: hypothetical protein VF753_10580 [Terriglobales bacterium]
MALAATPSTTLRVVHSGEPKATQQRREKRLAIALLAAAGANWAFQIVWFWRFTSHNINYDAISYIGIARHLARGDFSGSLNGYWSPLISWLIAGLSGVSGDFTLLGRLASIGAFLLCLPLLYRLTFSLWRSRALAAAAVLWFTLARGVVAFSVFFIGADFLLTAIVLAYFTVLLHCLRAPTAERWLKVGVWHGLAFLAKAIAFPWLMVPTLLACAISPRRNRRVMGLRAIAALAIPFMIWTCWGFALKTKYGVFTAGYQSKWNLLDERAREAVDAGPKHLSVLRDTSQDFDRDMVADNLPPHSPLWQTKLEAAESVRMVLGRERENLPQALKELVILITPGGVLTLVVAVCWGCTGVGTKRRPEARLLWIVLASAASLIGAYCMLVFDGRYLFPIIPLLIAVAVPFAVPGRAGYAEGGKFSRLRVVAFVLVASGTVLSLFYHASPFRSLRRDFQTSCYDAAQKPSRGQCKRLAVIGAGPYPEQGVGWEAGIYASYFAGCQIIAFSPELPHAGQSDLVEDDLRAVDPDAVLIFGRAGTAEFHANISAASGALPDVVSEAVSDPEAGRVGMLLLKTNEPTASVLARR